MSSQESSSEHFDTLEVSRQGAVATVRLARPDEYNSFDEKLHVEFTRALEELSGRRDVRAIVLLSSGKVFSAGGDWALMRECHEHVQNRLRITDDGRHLMQVLLDLPQPLVVGLNGDAIGLAASIVLCADAVVAPRRARIGDPHVRVGLVAGDGGCFAWPAAVGLPRARRYLLTGEMVGAEDAWQWGMVTDLVDEVEDAESRAREIAEEMAALPPLAVQGTKRALNRVTQLRAGEVLDLAFALEIMTLGSDDLLEGIRAFQERRPGEFRGS